MKKTCPNHLQAYVLTCLLNKNQYIMKKKAIIPHMDKIKLTGFIILLLTIAGFTACSELNLNASEGEGTINFYMSESSVNSEASVSGNSINPNNSIEGLQEVNIDIQELRVRFSSVRIDTVNADSVIVEEDQKGKHEWLTIPITPVKLNLLDVSNADILLSSDDLPAGYYSEIRLILGNDSDVVDENGDVHSLRTPSGQQSGYKIKFNSRLHSGEEFDITINFNAEKSIRLTGNNRYMLHPVLHAEKGRNNAN